MPTMRKRSQSASCRMDVRICTSVCGLVHKCIGALVGRGWVVGLAWSWGLGLGAGGRNCRGGFVGEVRGRKVDEPTGSLVHAEVSV